MTEPMLTGSIKKQKIPSLKKCNLIIESLSTEDDISNLFVADIKFKEEKANEKICCLTKVSGESDRGEL